MLRITKKTGSMLCAELKPRRTRGPQQLELEGTLLANVNKIAKLVKRVLSLLTLIIVGSQILKWRGHKGEQALRSPHCKEVVRPGS